MYPDFHDLMHSDFHDDEKTALQRLLIQAVACLSTTERYERITPGEVYNHIVAMTKEAHSTSPRHGYPIS